MRVMLTSLGHNRTEEVGTKYLPEWLETLMPGMPVWFSEAGEPFSYL
jgi:putative NIF3 family GTP cyclohydrolase 1 type 2